MASSHSAAIICTATEHARILQAAARDRADTSETNLEVTLFHFLTYMLQDHVSICLCRYDSDEVDKIITEYDCIDVVEETLSNDEVLGYTTGQLLEHKRIWDVVTRNKEGYGKEHFFSDWCRRVARHSTATEQKCLLPSDHWPMNCWLPSLRRNRKEIPSTSLKKTIQSQISSAARPPESANSYSTMAFPAS